MNDTITNGLFLFGFLPVPLVSQLSTDNQISSIAFFSFFFLISALKCFAAPFAFLISSVALYGWSEYILVPGFLGMITQDCQALSVKKPLLSILLEPFVLRPNVV